MRRRCVGQMLMVVFDGLCVTADIRLMIEKYYVGNILLTARNIGGICHLLRSKTWGEIRPAGADVEWGRRCYTGWHAHAGPAEDCTGGGIQLPFDDCHRAREWDGKIPIFSFFFTFGP